MGWALVFDSSDSDSSMAYAFNFFSVPGICVITGLGHALKLMENIFSNFCKHILSISDSVILKSDKKELHLKYVTCLI
jgi:hypothetical protein